MLGVKGFWGAFILLNVRFYMEKDEPHPQVVDALGFTITNRAPSSPSM